MEPQEIAAYFAKKLADAGQYIAQLGALLPAFVLVIEAGLLRGLGANIKNEKDQERYDTQATWVKMIRNEIIGAWIITNSQTAVGEGAGLALMAFAPFSESFNTILDVKYEPNADEAWEKNLDALKAPIRRVGGV